jgi:hypothetical protein
MMVCMASIPAPSRARSVGALDIPAALVAPRRVFARVEDVPGYGWPLVILITMMTMIGLATVETGLIDLEVERRIQQDIAAMEKQQVDVVERSTLSKLIEEKREEGRFLRLMEHLRVIVAAPASVLVSVLLIASLFYAIVALTGRKPEWNTLLTIGVFASFIDALRALSLLGLMLHFGTLSVSVSLAPLAKFLAIEGPGAAQASAAVGGLLSAFDPFRIWFWVIMILGLSVTGQLRGWKVWFTCGFLWLAAAGLRTAQAVASAPQAA